MMNPFDAADLTQLIQAQHIMAWYQRLTPAMRQQCVDTIVDTQAVMEFIGQAIQHVQHDPHDFDSAALGDLAARLQERMSR